ncbi:hypothetical protein J2W80_006617 [Methylorubrum extorquens]|jgi:hypothetical protein|nr:hypothetical protein [Methylorubrum extorquens]MCP1591968.1 hypothetical protein [Methylorubrum extorquens]
MLAIRAFRNMMSAAARDPLWAISTLILRAAHGGP